jgi:hypothetical protein
MTREDIIHMAHKVGLHLATDSNWMPVINLEYAEKFAAFVANAEREACAKVAENTKAPFTATAIRARGQA